MIGLEFIRSAYGFSKSDVAEKVNVARQNVHQWETEQRKITKKYIPILSKIFELPKEYFQKELTETEMADVRGKHYLKSFETALREKRTKLEGEFDEEIIDVQMMRDNPAFTEIYQNTMRILMYNAFTEIETYMNALQGVKYDDITKEQYRTNTLEYLSFTVTEFAEAIVGKYHNVIELYNYLCVMNGKDTEE